MSKNRLLSIITIVVFSNSFLLSIEESKKETVIKKIKTLNDNTSIQKDQNERRKFEEKYNKPSGVNIITSDLGVKIYHKKDSSAPLVHIVILFKNSGSSYQEKDKMGVPKLYSSAVFCGSGKYSQNQLEQELTNISSNITCNANNDIISFFMTSPTIVLNETIPLFKAVICYPKFEKEKVIIVQNGIIGRMQNYAMNPFAIAKNVFIPSIIFSKPHVYENGILGSAEDFSKLTIDDLTKYKKHYIVISNVEACIFGDISEEKAKSVIDQLIGNLEKGKPAPDDIPDIIPTISNITKKYYAQGPQSTIIFALKNERILSPDRYAAEILFKILGEGYLSKSRILDLLRTKLGLIYSGGVSSVDLNHTSYIIGVLMTENAKVNKAIDALRSIIKDLRMNGITNEELNFAKNNIAGSVIVNLRTSEDICNFFFSAMKYNLGTNALNNLLNGIHNVCLEDVKTLANKILDENNITIVVIGGNSK